MGTAVIAPKEGLKGVYAASMNTGTSKVNWNDVNSNKAKIAEYKDRMLGNSMELGYMANGAGDGSVQGVSYQPYGSRVVGDNYLGYNANARDNKAND